MTEIHSHTMGTDVAWSFLWAPDDTCIHSSRSETQSTCIYVAKDSTEAGARMKDSQHSQKIGRIFYH